MLEDMQLRNLAPATQRNDILHVARFAKHSGKSPDLLSLEDAGPLKQLSADYLARLLRSRIVAARRVAPPSPAGAFDAPLGSAGFRLSAGVCYRALRRLPGEDLRLLEHRVFRDAPWIGR